MSVKISSTILLACMLASFESLISLDSQASTNKIQGEYENKALGIKLTFPEGWAGTISSLENDSTIFLTLNKESIFPELSASDFSTITLAAGKNLSSLNAKVKANSLYENCRTVEKSAVSISGRDFMSSFVQCPTIHYKTYTYSHGPKLTLNYTYAALPSSFEGYLKDFETSVHTLLVS
jgi:hypothetical protein